MKNIHCDVAVIGAGSVGIATAYYLKKLRPEVSIVLLDASEPMALTSAQSGENYRNWWPHPVMTAFTDRSIDLMEELAKETNNLIGMNRRGYVLATRADNSDKLMDELEFGYSQLDHNDIRVHDSNKHARSYRKPDSPTWETAPSGVDVLKDQTLIRETYPSYDRDIKTVVHIRRAGAISAQQMGQYMLDGFKSASGKFVKAEVNAIEYNNGFQLHTKQSIAVNAERIVNAAGPYIKQIAEMLSIDLPVQNVLQQKIAFIDTAKAIPRNMPFSIDLDAQIIDWSDEDRNLLRESEEYQWLTQELPGAIHCRPEGGDKGSWLKLGWAFNNAAQDPDRDPALMESFPEIVLRGAARLNPALKQYYTRLPSSLHHYGGFYTLTEENWPLIGPMDSGKNSVLEGAFVVGAMSGFGSMAAAAAGDLCARLMMDASVPAYAPALSPQRYKNNGLMAEIRALSQRGIL